MAKNAIRLGVLFYLVNSVVTVLKNYQEMCASERNVKSVNI